MSYIQVEKQWRQWYPVRSRESESSSELSSSLAELKSPVSTKKNILRNQSVKTTTINQSHYAAH